MEEWRKKSYYRTRVLIPVNECLDSAFGDCVVCLTGGQLNLVRNLLQYAYRRSTFVSIYEEQFYWAPSETQWDDLQALVADLEGKLMDCETFSNMLAEILARLRNDLSLPEPPFTEDESDAFPISDELGDDDVGEQTQSDACAIAQLWYQWGLEVITESVLPATRFGFDYLVTAIAGFIGLAVGGPPAAMGLYLVAEFIQELLEILYDGAETNLLNWLASNKDDIVCSLYWGLQEVGNASDIWAITKSAVLDGAEGISDGDKLIINLFMGTWAGSNASRAWTAQTQWAQDNVTPGYCASCPSDYDFEYHYVFPPCPGDWVSNGPYAVCWNDYPGCHQYADVNHGEWYGPSTTEFAGLYLEGQIYIEFSSNNGAGLDVGYIVLDQKPVGSGSWAGVGGTQLVLTSIGGQNWTSALSDPFVFTAIAGYEYRLRIRADYRNNSNPTQIVTRKVDFWLNETPR